MKTTTLALIITMLIIISIPSFSSFSCLPNSLLYAAEPDSSAIKNKSDLNDSTTPVKLDIDQAPSLKEKLPDSNRYPAEDQKKREHDELKKKRKAEPFV